MADAYLSLESIQGDRLAHLRLGLMALAPVFAVRKLSAVYESALGSHADSTYTLAAHGISNLSPRELLKYLHVAEQSAGRTQAERGAIDIDLLLYDDLVLETLELTVPHPRLHERPAIVVALNDIAPLSEHPVLRIPMIELWEAHRGGGGVVFRVDADS